MPDTVIYWEMCMSVRVLASRAIKSFSRRAGINLAPDFTSSLPQADRDIINACQPFTMTSPERLSSLISAVRYVEARGIKGAIVECGVWKGGSCLAIAKTLQSLGVTNRDIYLYDTYEGMSEPTEYDREAATGSDAASMLSGADKSETVWAYSPIEEVRRNISGSGYPSNRIHFVKGKVEDTIPATMPSSIAILRLDTDWYESTKHELTHLYPALEPAGVLIIDDYGHWDGARKAVDEYFMPNPVLLNRIDYTGRITVKA